MRPFGEYEVLGTREYRGHKPGETFEARLDKLAEERAIARGSIRRLRWIQPRVEPGTFTFPDGWLEPPSSSKPGSPQGASHIGGGG